MSYFTTYLEGLGLGLGLIIAIGAQNAFVLRQGLRREYIVEVVILCAAADALLICLGVFGLAAALGERPVITQLLTLFGAIFLASYGWLAWRRSKQHHSLAIASDAGLNTRLLVLSQAAAFTFLNPHVYLDTVLLVGGVGAQKAQPLQIAFVAGGVSASAAWFGTLGFGAARLAPKLNQARTWQWLDRLVACLMVSLSGVLVVRLVGSISG